MLGKTGRASSSTGAPILQHAVVCVQGDGTAVCLQDEPRAFTLSVHSDSNFPSRKQKSNLDVPLPDGVGDEKYMRWAPVQPDQWRNKTRPGNAEKLRDAWLQMQTICAA